MAQELRADPASPSPLSAVAEGSELTTKVVEVTSALLRSMGMPGEVSCRDFRSDESPHLWVEIVSRESGLLIGERGSTLLALEHVLRRCLRPVVGDAVRVMADVNAYRRHRMELVRRLAHAAAQRARRTGRAVALEPMGAADRRVVHVALVEEEGIATESAGEEPVRRVIVRPRDPLA